MLMRALDNQIKQINDSSGLLYREWHVFMKKKPFLGKSITLQSTTQSMTKQQQ